MEKGTLKQNGVHLQDHEYATVKLLLENGYDIELIPPSQIKNLRMPDIMMCELPWEMKAPEGKSKYTAQNIIQDAVKQAQNVIVDLRRCKLLESRALSDFKREFEKSKHIKRMKIIRKNLEILDFSK